MMQSQTDRCIMSYVGLVMLSELACCSSCNMQHWDAKLHHSWQVACWDRNLCSFQCQNGYFNFYVICAADQRGERPIQKSCQNGRQLWHHHKTAQHYWMTQDQAILPPGAHIGLCSSSAFRLWHLNMLVVVTHNHCITLMWCLHHFAVLCAAWDKYCLQMLYAVNWLYRIVDNATRDFRHMLRSMLAGHCLLQHTRYVAHKKQIALNAALQAFVYCCWGQINNFGLYVM